MQKYKSRENMESGLKDRKLRMQGKNNEDRKLNIVKKGKREGGSDRRI